MAFFLLLVKENKLTRGKKNLFILKNDLFYRTLLKPLSHHDIIK